MAQPEDDRADSVHSYLDSANDWRRNARHVRELADRPHLDPQARAALLREAGACEKQADIWQAQAEDAGAEALMFPAKPQVIAVSLPAVSRAKEPNDTPPSRHRDQLRGRASDLAATGLSIRGFRLEGGPDHDRR